MEHTALQVYQFSLESAIAEWFTLKKIRTGSEKIKPFTTSNFNDILPICV